MNRFFLSLFFFVIYISQTHAQKETDFLQNITARKTVSLDGQWEIIVDPYQIGFEGNRRTFFKNDSSATDFDYVEYKFEKSNYLNVPGDWNSQREELFFYEGVVWYKKIFNTTKNSDLRYFIHFGAANYLTKVYLNGKPLGSHEGGFTPFAFEITQEFTDGKNELVVAVDNTRKEEYVPNLNTDWWNYGGITRSVNLVETPKVFIKDYALQLYDNQSDKISISVELSEPISQNVLLKIEELEIEKKIRTNSKGMGTLILAAKPQLWSPENPKRYTVQLGIGEEFLTDQIGFRTIKTKGTKILLNGKSIFLRGVSIHDESPYQGKRIGTHDEAKQLLLWAKEMNCNFIRLAHYPHNEYMVRLADELGFLVWSEIPVYWKIPWKNNHAYSVAESQLVEMIERDKNRASIIIWSVANETPDIPERSVFLNKLIDKVHALDATRLVSAALHEIEYNEHTNTKTIKDKLVESVDIMSVNNYCGWYEYPKNGDCGLLKWSTVYNKPLIMSEFGGGALKGFHGEKSERWTEEFQAEIYRQNIRMFKNIDFLAGLSPWILKDFRSPRRFFPGIQDYWNRKGLISNKGIKKAAFHIMQEYYQKLENTDSQK